MHKGSPFCRGDDQATDDSIECQFDKVVDGDELDVDCGGQQQDQRANAPKAFRTAVPSTSFT